MSSFSDFMIPTPAMEADDITERVAQQMQGKGGQSDVASATGEDREEDLTQVDNIYEEATSPEKPQQDDTSNNDQDDTDQGDTDADNAEDTQDQDASGEDPLSRNDSDGDDEQSDDSQEGETQDDASVDTFSENPAASVFSDKNTLKANVIYFMDILKSNEKALTVAIGNLDELSDIKCCNAVIANLRRTYDILHRMVTEEMKDKTYEELVTTYVTSKRVYDISIEMLNKHFIKDGKRKSPINSRRSEPEKM